VLHRLVAVAFALGPVAFASGASAATDPCKLVSQAEASKALGAAAEAATESQGTSGATCRYYNSDHTKNVFVQMMSPATVSGMESTLHLKPLAGVSAPAYWLAGSVFMVKRAQAVQLTLYMGMGSMTKMEPGVVPLAKLVAARL
jgi:hypothetical protein